MKITKCQYCGEPNLKWFIDLKGLRSGWRMVHEDGTPHSCKEYRDAKESGNLKTNPDPDPTNGSHGVDPAQWGE